MNTDSTLPVLRPFLDERLRLTALPAKQRKKLPALYYLAGKFEPARDYSESEVNDLLDTWSTFHDPAALRRELFNHCLLNRTDNCARYWLEADIPELPEFIAAYL